MSSVNLSHHFLIAMPNMVDPHFSKTLTYVCEHNEQGALGLVINRPIEMTLARLLEHVSIQTENESHAAVPVHYGGPVQINRGFILHEPAGPWESTLKINPDLGLTTSRDILEAIARGDGPRQILVTLGYAGWGAGQLEHELAQNAWLSVAAEPHLMFELSAERRLPAAMALLGVNYASLSDAAGHA
jgi:putative transcriptional regulator